MIILHTVGDFRLDVLHVEPGQNRDIWTWVDRSDLHPKCCSPHTPRRGFAPPPVHDKGAGDQIQIYGQVACCEQPQVLVQKRDHRQRFLESDERCDHLDRVGSPCALDVRQRNAAVHLVPLESGVLRVADSRGCIHPHVSLSLDYPLPPDSRYVPPSACRCESCARACGLSQARDKGGERG